MAQYHIQSELCGRGDSGSVFAKTAAIGWRTGKPERQGGVCVTWLECRLSPVSVRVQLIINPHFKVDSYSLPEPALIG